MQNLWGIILSAFLAQAVFAEPIKVVTWNLQWFPGGTPNPTPEQVSNSISRVQLAIKALNPDVLLLQEVADQGAAENAIALVPKLAVHTVSRFPGSFGRSQQQAICSRFEARGAWSESWQKGWAGPPRGFAFAALKLSGEKTLLVYSMHLKSNIGDAIENTNKREDAIAQLLTHYAKMQTDYDTKLCVIGGDFNTDIEVRTMAGERTFDLLRNAGFWWGFTGLPLTARVTCPAKGSYPDACFDHLFSVGCGKPTAETYPDRHESDHRPVSWVMEPEGQN